jgi:hypothetical protein
MVKKKRKSITIQHGDLTRIAAKVGCSLPFVSDVFAGKKRPSPEMAVKFEVATKVDRRAWIWPEEFENPLMPR